MGRLIATIVVLCGWMVTMVSAPADVTYGSGAQSAVQAWWASGRSPGDVYIMDPGTWVWSSADAFGIQDVTVFGSGIDVTFIEYTDTGAGNRQIIDLKGTARFSNLTIQDAAAPLAPGGFGGVIKATASATGVSIDNIKFTAPASAGYRAIYADSNNTKTQSPTVVVHNCIFNHKGYTAYLRNGAGDYGDYTWATAPPMGTDAMVVFEDNQIGIEGNSSSFDGDAGALYCIRENDFLDSYVHGHGVTSGRFRGTRWVEVYNNNFEWVGITNRIAMVELRSGSGMVFNNSIIPASTGEPDNFVNLSNYRVGWHTVPWGYSDGKNFWDIAFTDDDAGTPGGAGDGVYETGTITSVISDDEFMDSSKSGIWTDDQWRFYTLRVLGPQGITAAAGSSGSTIIVSPDPGWTVGAWNGWPIRNLVTGEQNRVATSTSDTLNISTDTGDLWPNFSVSPGDTFDLFFSNSLVESSSTGYMKTNSAGTGDGDNDWADVTGLSYELRKVRQVIDGIGKGISSPTSLGTGQAINPPLGGFSQPPAAYPWYEWGNTSTGSIGSRIARGGLTAFTVTQEIEFFDYEASFDGTAGVGVGVKADISPGGAHETASTVGVGYWVTDEADWNKTTPGTPDGQLYQWDGDSWELYYTPLEYPHPIRATLDPLPGQAGAAYGGRLRLDNTKRPIKVDGTGRPYIFAN